MHIKILQLVPGEWYNSTDCVCMRNSFVNLYAQLAVAYSATLTAS